MKPKITFKTLPSRDGRGLRSLLWVSRREENPEFHKAVSSELERQSPWWRVTGKYVT